jgi:SAM-dependent methyltransferase
MTAQPDELYAEALTAARTRRPAQGWRLRYSDGASTPLPLRRWCGDPDAADESVLARCADPTLDAGCGPGRLVAALHARGRVALGVDTNTAAVEIARAADAPVLHRSVFDALPGKGGWATVLLLDGNIGIGGKPIRLLSRCRRLLRPDGEVLVELDRASRASGPVRLRLVSPTEVSEEFPWAHVTPGDLQPVAEAAGLAVTDRWSAGRRQFAALRRA